MLIPDARKIDLDCGIAYRRIAEWLDEELELPFEGDTWSFEFELQTCRIVIEPLEPRQLGSYTLDRTHLVAEGDIEALAEFDRLFTLRFISAGG